MATGDTTGKIKRTANLQLVKETNLALVFNLIYKQRPISRADLAKKTRLSPTTVSSLVDELRSRGMVMETGAGDTVGSGRKPIMIDIDAGGGCVASVELVENGFNGSLYDLVCNEICKQSRTVKDFNEIGGELARAVSAMLDAGGVPEDRLMGITVGVPGLIDYGRSRVISSTVLPVDEENDFMGTLKDRFPGIPVLLENESCFCAYAEKEYGHAQGARNLVFIDVNVGIGAGILIDGSVYRGSFGLAGEIGHISIDMNGPRCKCGNRGCLEIMAGIPAMVQKIVFAILSGKDTLIRDMIRNDFNRIHTGVIRKAMDAGDGTVLEVVDEIAGNIAFGINNVINLFNPQAVVIGGEITGLGPVFLEGIRSHLRKIELKPNAEQIEIRYSTLEGNAAVIGGARFMLDHIFHTPGLLAARI